MGRDDGEVLGGIVAAGDRGGSDMAAAGDGTSLMGSLGSGSVPTVSLSIISGRFDGALLGERVSAGARGSSEGLSGDGAGLWPAHSETSDASVNIIAITTRGAL